MNQNRIKDYSIKDYPSEIIVFYYVNDDYFHQNFDKGILKESKAKIKDIKEDIEDFIDNSGLKIAKRLGREIARKIEWYI